jgi:hypothetical protein
MSSRSLWRLRSTLPLLYRLFQLALMLLHHYKFSPHVHNLLLKQFQLFLLHTNKLYSNPLKNYYNSVHHKENLIFWIASKAERCTSTYLSEAIHLAEDKPFSGLIRISLASECLRKRSYIMFRMVGIAVPAPISKMTSFSFAIFSRKCL